MPENNTAVTAAGGESSDGGGQKRDAWSSKLEFFLTCIGFAVGLGNVWRFPYMCYKNGGGAFLIPYFIMLALVGMPLFYLELCFGQFASLGPTAIWSINPTMKGIGFAMVITCTIIGLYYNVIIAWSLYYFFASMTSQLPWEYCGNWWNTDYCYHFDDLKNITGWFLPGPINQVLRISDGIDELGKVRWQLVLCLLLCWIIVFLVLIKGIATLGKVVYFTSIFPYVLLTILLIRGVTLEGASYGILYYVKPDWSRLLDASVWTDAASQIFYNLGTAMGSLIAMSSYNGFRHNCKRDAILVPIINCLTSFYAGFVIFSVLGFMATQKGVTIDEVADGGPGLVFVVYPEALTQMPVAPLWSVLFFFMLLTLGFSSEFSMVECFFASVTDEFPNIFLGNRKNQLYLRASGMIIFFLISIPMVTEGGYYWFNLIDVFIGGFPLLIIGLVEIIALIYIYGYPRLSEDIALMLGVKPNVYFIWCWKAISPLILLLVIIFMAINYTSLTLFDTYTYPDWSLNIGWLIVVFPLIFIPGVFIFAFMRRGGLDVLKSSAKPTKDWKPALPENRLGRYKMQ